MCRLKQALTKNAITHLLHIELGVFKHNELTSCKIPLP